VSTSFSLLYLIRLTDFRKKACFRPNVLNYLNKTFTFGKHTKDSDRNRNFQRRPAHSFIHFRDRFSLGETCGGSSPRKTRNTS